MISRRRASIRNASMAFITQIIMMVGQFAVQTIFVHTLGAEYLGANGLFNNLITFLSFAELGIGAAFSYALYKPLAENNKSVIAAIMALFRKVYNTIGIIILAAGLVLSYFVPWFIEGTSTLPHVRFYFILYLLSTVVSYFFTYNRSLLIADQKSYVDSLNQFIFNVGRYILQIIFLVSMHSYVAYLVLMILSNLLSNIAITARSHKRYPYLKTIKGEKVDPAILAEIKHNVVGTISSKVGAIVVAGTDNILISKFLGLVIVGIYSNYALVLTSITRLLTQVFSSVIASFGNLGVTEKDNTKKQLDMFDQFTYYNALSVFFIGLVAFAFFPPFIRLWLGNRYQLPEVTLYFIIVNFVLGQFRPALNMVNAYGLFWGYRVKSIVEAAVNLGLSLALVQFTSMGINGVLFGTIIGNILVNSWWDPMILFRGAYHTSMLQFYVKYWVYLLTFGVLLAAEGFLLSHLRLNIHGLFPVVGFGLICCLVVLVVLMLVFSHTKGQKGLFVMLRSLGHGARRH
ncbi:lipopolysaccharide biosynthesis protein [Lacticaseibacillus jixianensis]|uniref:Lipopolysaccharide biosynthesis protein n=1 Tax=Lacticaseibacillus jixianensis TaxID=2486012 RepID=A0ABW4BA79_9LACO|nr:transporter [Lacticaseibacillus jixianensis]